MFGAFLGPLAGNAVIALIPRLQDAFNTSVEVVVLSVTLFMVPFAAMQVFSGTISDLFDRRIVLASGFYVYAFGSLLFALAPNIVFLLGARVVQGLWSAFITPVIMAILGDTVPFERRGKAMGFLGAATAAGVATSPLLAGLISVNFDWRWVFFLIFILSTLFGSVFMLTLGELRVTEREVNGARDLFYHLKEAISDIRVPFLGTSAFLMFFSYIGALTFTADSLAKDFSMRDDEIGFILFSAGIAAVMMAPFAGFLIDFAGRKKIAALGFVIMFIDLIFLNFADSFILFVIVFFLLGCGTALSWTALNTMAVELIPKSRSTVASLYNSFRFSGYATSPVLLSTIYLELSVMYVYAVCATLVLLNLGILSLIRMTR